VIVALAAAAGAVAAVVVSTGRAAPSSPTAFVETWIDAWNARDAQAVSAMTCDERPAYVPAGIIETYLRQVPADAQVVADHRITGQEPGVAYDWEAVRVHVIYLPWARDALRETSIYVRVRDDGDMCIGAFTTW
jgi:hypothetical protein